MPQDTSYTIGRRYSLAKGSTTLEHHARTMQMRQHQWNKWSISGNNPCLWGLVLAETSMLRGSFSYLTTTPVYILLRIWKTFSIGRVSLFGPKRWTQSKVTSLIEKPQVTSTLKILNKVPGTQNTWRTGRSTIEAWLGSSSAILTMTIFCHLLCWRSHTH